MSAAEQIAYLATYNRDTGSLSTLGAENCGYGDLLRAGYLINRGTPEMPDLFITQAGRDLVGRHSRPINSATVKSVAQN